MPNWNRRRQIIYLLLVIAFFALLAGLGYWHTRPLPTCVDAKQNQGETGIDCGGPCSKVCLADVLPLQTIWIRPFEIVPGSYSVVGLFENPNHSLGLERLFYTIHLLAADGATIGTRAGETFVNPEEKFAIFEGPLDTHGQKPARAFIDFNPDMNWQHPTIEKPVLAVIRKDFDTGLEPKLHALITNESSYDLDNITVPVVLSDQNSNAFSGSATVVESLPRGATRDIYFTWPAAFPALPSLVDFYPRVNTFKINR